MKKNNIFGYQKEFDILRAISVILVILFHLNEDLFFFGFIGVDIFFVISGFVITQSLFNYYRTYGSEGFILNFFFRRIKRIYPALIIVLLFSITIYLFIIPFGDHQYLWTIKSLFFSIFGLSNIYFYKNIDNFDYFHLETTTPFLHTWSLGVEEQFYILFPFLLIFFFRSKLKFIYLQYLFLFLFFASLYIFLDTDLKISHFYLLPSRAWEILLGSIFFLYKNRFKLNINIPKVSFNFLIFILTIMLIFLYILERSIDYRHLVVLTLISLLLLINFNNKDRKFIFENYFLYLGKLSYSLYLWHFPILFFVNYYIDGYMKYVLVITFTLIFSYFSYNFVELPVRKIKLKNNYIRNLFLSLSGIIIILISLHFSNYINVRTLLNHNFVNINKTFKDKNLTKDSIEYRIANKWFLDNDTCNNKIENFGSDKYLNCIRSEDNKNLFFISGDSFGEHFVNVLSPEKSTLFRNIYLSKINNKFFLNDDKAKHETIESFLSLSKKFENSYFILSISHQKDFNIEQLIKFLNNLENNKIIIIQPHQKTNKWIRDCIDHAGYLKIITSYISPKNCIYDLRFDKDRINTVNKKLKKINQMFDNITLYNFDTLICKTSPCNLYNKKDDLIYFTDNTHLTVEAAKLISQHFEMWFKNEHF